MIDHISCNTIDQFSTYDALPFVHHRELYTIKIDKKDDVTNYIYTIDNTSDVVLDSSGFYIKFPTSISEYPIYGKFAKSYYVDQNFSEVKFDDITILKDYTSINSKSIVIQGGYASGLNSIAISSGSVYGNNSVVHGTYSTVSGDNSAAFGYGLTDQIRQIKLKEIDNNCYDVIDNKKLYWRGELDARRYNCSVVKGGVVKNVVLTFAIFEQNFVYHIDNDTFDSIVVLIPTPSETRLMLGNYNYPIENSYFEIGNGNTNSLKTIFYADKDSVYYGSYTSNESKTVLKSSNTSFLLGNDYLSINENNLSINKNDDLSIVITKNVIEIKDAGNYYFYLGDNLIKYNSNYVGGEYSSIVIDNTSSILSHSNEIEILVNNIDALINVDAVNRSQFNFTHTSQKSILISESSNINELYVSASSITLSGNVPPSSTIAIIPRNGNSNNLSTIYYNEQFTSNINDRFSLFNNGLAKGVVNLYSEDVHTGIYYSETDSWSNVILSFKDNYTYGNNNINWLNAIITSPTGDYFEYRVVDRQYPITPTNRINPRGSGNVKCGFVFATTSDSTVVFSNQSHYQIIETIRNSGPGTFKQTLGTNTNRYNWTGLSDISNYDQNLKLRYAKGNPIDGGYKNTLIEIFFDAYNLFTGSFSRCKDSLTLAGNNPSLLCGILIEIDEELCENISSRLEEIAVSYHSRASTDGGNEREGQVIESNPNNATGTLTSPNNPKPWRSLEMYAITYALEGKTYIFIINADDYNGILRYVLMPGDTYKSVVSMVDETLANASDPASHLGGRGGYNRFMKTFRFRGFI